MFNRSDLHRIRILVKCYMSLKSSNYMKAHSVLFAWTTLQSMNNKSKSYCAKKLSTIKNMFMDFIGCLEQSIFRVKNSFDIDTKKLFHKGLSKSGFQNSF
ncbi:hypothetical protein BpHYR1_000831 [Brachionus plicatilis]|uniref:Uncharacterized protein n=1 Tax=Brachionus plicatilis TaxID=10195 RepID=A0A3M7SFX5_BRAPC|nr:hypothetical protein BpHYR1_000831 [Brachionus plicatilis]